MADLKVVPLPERPKRKKPPRIRKDMLVVLRSGGPVMVVHEVKGDDVTCAFFDDEQEIARPVIPASLLDPFHGEIEFYVSGVEGKPSVKVRAK